MILEREANQMSEVHRLPWRDYSLTGADSGPGFAPDEWYRTPVSRARLKELMRRRNMPGLIDYGIWLGLVLLTGAWVVFAWGGWWCVPAMFLYGIFYGSCAHSRWHECSHGTVFRAGWLNAIAFYLTSFMALKNPLFWRWSHTRHHTDTIIVGRDPEIAFPRPPHPLDLLTNLLHLQAGWVEMKKMVRLALGLLNKDELSFLAESDRQKAFWTSRVQLAILLLIGAVSVALQSWLPLVLVGLPTFYGSWLHHLLASLQHAGLAEDVPDHRLNSRSIHMNPFLRFVYSSMNFHLEHHMYPMVPSYNLPSLHEEIKWDCPPPYPSTYAAFREMIPAILKQRRDPLHCVDRKSLIPASANPTPMFVRPKRTATQDLQAMPAAG